MAKNIKEHKEKYWHIRKFNLRLVFALFYFISTLVALLWMINVTDTNKPVLVIPLILITLGLGYGWIEAINRV